MAEKLESHLAIPVLDVKRMTDDPDEMQKLAAELHQAFTNVGFVGIANHGVPQQLVSHCFCQIRLPAQLFLSGSNLQV